MNLDIDEDSVIQVV
jgi:hypothetical protein